MQQSDWQVASFGDCADFQEGYVNPAQSVATYFDGPISWLRAVDLNDGFVTATSRTLSEEGFRSAGKSATMFPAGSLAISKSGTIGRIGILQHEMCGNRAVINVKPRSDRLDLRFAFYAMLLGRPEIERFAEGSVQKNLYVSALSKFKFLLPPLPEQRTIASVLGALDDKIELNRRMNETLEAMARAIFKDWFVDFGPTRAKMEGRAPYLAPDIWSLFPDRLDDEGKPEGWIETTVGTEFNLTMGQSPPGETYNESGDGLPFFQGRTDFGFRYPVRRKFCSAPTRVARPDDTLVSVRAPVGDLNMAWEECCIGRGVAAVRHKRGGRGYTQYSMQFLQPAIARFEDSGSVFGAINKVQFERLRVISPPPELMDQFEATVQGMDDRIRSNTSESETLAATRDFLLPKLMSGEVRVKEAEKIAGDAT